MNSNIINGIDIRDYKKRVERVVWRRRKAASCCMGVDDIRQSAMMGLAHAAHKFDDSKGFKFWTYAEHWVRSYVQNEIAINRLTVNIPQKKANNVGYSSKVQLPDRIDANYSDSFADEVMKSFDNFIDVTETETFHRQIFSSINYLKDYEKDMIIMRFVDDESHRVIGEKYGYSREYSRRKINIILDKIKSRVISFEPLGVTV